MLSVHCVFASGSGHTEYVVQVLQAYLKEKGVELTTQRAETATPEDFARGDVLLLGSGTWNTGGVEGQLHPHMYTLLNQTAKDADLAGKRATCIALGDERYYYTARSGEHQRKYIMDHGGEWCCDALTIINEPYGQEERVQKWAEKLLTRLAT